MVDREQAETAASEQPRAARPLGPGRFFNRELSWLQFNRRVLGEALAARHPLLERVKFLAIFSTNLDEFFMVRVSGIHEQIAAGVTTPSPDGLTPSDQLDRIKTIVDELSATQHRCWMDDLRPQLRAQGIHVLNYDELDDAQRAAARTLFHEQIFPVLTPLAFDPGHPFPHISNLSLNLAVVVGGPNGERFARVKVPEVLPRLVELPSADATPALAWIEQIIAANANAMFPGVEVLATYPFRVIRDTDVEIQEDEAGDLLRTIEQGIRERFWGQAVRLNVDDTMPKHVLEILSENLEIVPRDIYRVQGPLGLASLMQLYSLDRPDLKDAPFVPRTPPAVEAGDPFTVVQRGDVLLHHPFESFMPVVDLLQLAAEDPNVLAIKQTLYRVGSNSPVVAALKYARERGKQVTVLVELKARFDEENNIEWARQLEGVGVHVVYGMLGLKTHAKVLLLVRKEHDGLRRYVHLSTGNYNASTARLYTDIGLLTSDREIGADASELFNYLTGYSAQHSYRKFAVAPIGLRRRMVELIQREIGWQRETGAGRLIFKMNTLTDARMIELLYEASGAGVQIDLIVRGVCCLRPGLPGLSENIRVRSIIGRFLEHSRVYLFGNGGAEEVYMTSADLMSRNLDRRVETFFPIRRPELVTRIRDEILDAYLRDTANAHLLRPDGTYIRPPDTEPPFDSQLWLIEQAAAETRGRDE